MVKDVLAVVFACFMLSCEERPATPQEMILGHWSPDYSSNPTEFRGFEFLANGLCDYKVGFFDVDRFIRDTTSPRIRYFLGTETKYIITDDSLKIYDLEKKRWQKYKLRKLSSDTLVINNENTSNTFIKKHCHFRKTEDFDAIVASTLNGSIILDKQGNVTLLGKYNAVNQGYCNGKISEKTFEIINSKFKFANYSSIIYNPNEISSSGSATTLSFIRDEQIIHSVVDRRFDNNELYWAYTPLLYLEQKLELKPKRRRHAFLDLDNVYAQYRNQTSFLELTGAESFYLGELLQNGKQSDYNFIEIYQLGFGSTAEKITTDGRYYKFYLKDKSTKTIDIGYDFLTNSLVYKFEKKYE